MLADGKSGQRRDIISNAFFSTGLSPLGVRDSLRVEFMH